MLPLLRSIPLRSLATAAQAARTVPPTSPEADKLFRRIEFEVRGHDKAVLQSYMSFLGSASSHLGITITPVEHLPYVRWVQWLLRSKFAHKKYKLHYETRTHIKKCSIVNVTGSTASTFVEYVQRQIPEGVGMKVTYEEISPLPEAIREALDEK